MTDAGTPRELYLADLRARREKIDALIRAVEDDTGPDGGGGAASTDTASSGAKSPKIERHEFVGLSTPEATKRYLRKIGKRLESPRNIAAALIVGGQSTQDAESVYQNVYSALKRMRANDEVVKQGQEWGLADVFPALLRKKKAKGNGDEHDDSEATDDETAA